MGSPLGPVLANLFMGYHEANWLQDCQIILYCRYVDDIICLFDSESDADKFYEFLNKQNPNIKFTFENQKKKKNQIHVSFTPLSYKIGLLKLQFIVLLKL